jgi:diguanylate cyclase (GGDEF)-like protein/PAS domain S-box-containing protein
MKPTTKHLAVMLLILVLSLSKTAQADQFNFDYGEVFERHGLVRLIIAVDTGELVYANQAAEDFYGYPRSTLLQMKISDINILTPEETQREWMAAAEQQRNYFLFRHRLANGNVRDVEVYSYPFESEGRQYLFSVVIDITQKVALATSLARTQRITYFLGTCVLFLLVVGIISLYASREKYRHMASRDMLTEVYSRSYLDQWEQRKAHASIAGKHLFTVVMIDVDKFRSINEEYGHALGDQVLIRVAGALKSSIRENDFVVRYGGDEFLLVLHKTTLPQAQHVMDRVAARLVQHSEFGFPIVLSFGVQEVSSEPDLFQAIKLADEKMHEMRRRKNLS